MSVGGRALDPAKLGLIELAFAARPGARTLADLGAVWGVDAGYALWARDRFALASTVIADSDLGEVVPRRCAPLADVRLVGGLLGDPGVAAAVGPVDVALLFDVLLHQVRPDWDELLSLYAPQVPCLAVFNPQWAGGGPSFRLPDVGRRRYFELVPHGADEPGYADFFDRLDDEHPPHRRRVRDVHYAWQWAITDRDLRAAMARLGYREAAAVDAGPFGRSPHFVRRGFVFVR